MSFEYWFNRLRRRLNGSPAVLLDQTVLTEADELWRAAQPADPAHPTPDEAARLATAGQLLGWLHVQRYAALPEESGQVELARAIVYVLSAGVRTAVPEPLRWLLGAEADPDQQSSIANALLEEAVQSGDPVLFNASIQLHDASVTDRGPMLAVRLSNLSAAYRERFKRIGSPGDADRAVEVGEAAFAAVAAGDPNGGLVLSEVGAAYVARFEQYGRLSDLDRAIQLGEHAMADFQVADPDRAMVLSNLCNAYLTRFDHTDQLSDVDKAVRFGELAVAALDHDDPDYAQSLTDLGTAHHERFERTGNHADLERAIACHQHALAATPNDDVDHATRLAGLGTVYLVRYGQSGEVSDLDHGITHLWHAVAAGTEDDHEQAKALTNLGEAFRIRFGRFGDVADLDRAVEYTERAVSTTPADHPDRALHLSNAGTARLTRYDRMGQPDDLDRAIGAYDRAVAVTPADHPDRALYLANLGAAFDKRFERTGNVSDMNRAVENVERAVDATPADHPDRALRLSNLSVTLMALFKRVGDVADLDRAVEAAKQAVTTTRAGHPDLAGYLANLGVTHRTRSDHIGSMADLDLAIAHNEHAVDATPTDHPARAMRLSNLGHAYLERLERVGLKSDMDRAIEVLGQAVAATPRDHADRVFSLSGLSQAYLARGYFTRMTADFDRAMDLGHQAFAATNGPDQARFLSFLGHASHLRWQVTDDAADLDKAIELHQRAVEETPTDHPLRADHLYYLGLSYQSRGDAGVAEVAARAEQAIAATTGRPYLRVRACWVFGRMAHALGDLHTARRALDKAVSLLPSTAARETSRADQELHLGGNLGLVGEAIAVHCALNDPSGAVEVGEQGRGILLAAQLNLRTSLAGLYTRFPALARRLHLARERLNAFDPSTVDGDVVGWSKRLWAEYDAVLAEVHAQGVPVAAPPGQVELRQAVAGRTVVLLNASRLRADAIVLTAGPPVLVPLPKLRLDDVERYATELREATHDPSPLTGELRRQRVLTELLGWLWDTTVEPILDLVAPGSRVWWLPTGVLGLLPLHAAGQPGKPGALDRVISSYAPTLRALARSGERPAAAARRQLTVTLERTPGLADLPATTAEAANLPADLPPLVNEWATVERVRSALHSASWAHFACHASTNPDAPSMGGLHLHDGLLPITEVSRLDLPEPELAYLSACSTGHAGPQHADESIHLASAFQLAGFRHVIASLWPLADRVAATAADRFYRRMPAGPSADGAALALHEVTRELRAEHPNQPHLWAPLIHSGP